MSPDVEIVPGDETQVENAAPEQELEVAHQDESKDDDQSPPEEKAEDALTDEQKTIKKLQRRIERLNGKVGATSRERDMLRELFDRLLLIGQGFFCLFLWRRLIVVL